MSDQAYNANNFNDDFEKVDPDNYAYAAEQDESVTSSSMPGEMAEEDRYTANEPDLLGDFSVGGSVPVIDKPSEPAGQPLISFGDSSPEPAVTASAPPKPEPSETNFTKTATPTEGCWMKTVDPRDEGNAMSDPTVTTMDEQPTPSESADLSASAATTTAAAGPGCGELNSQAKSETDVVDADNDIESSDEYSADESSSSSHSSESVSDLESSENEGVYVIDNPPEETVETEVPMDVDSPDLEGVSSASKQMENVDEDELEHDKSECQSTETTESSAFVEQVSETVSDIEDEMMPESVSQNMSENSAELVDSGVPKDDESISSENSSLSGFEINKAAENKEDNENDRDVKEENILDVGPISKSEETVQDTAESPVADKSVAKDEETLAKSEEQVEGKNDKLESADVPESHEEAPPLAEEDKVLDYKPVGLSEEEMSNLLDKLTSDDQEECLESVEKDEYLDNIESPVFEPEKKVCESVSSDDNSSDESSDNSEREDGDSSIDSDISGDEPVFGVWNPSPLHADDLGALAEDEGPDSPTDPVLSTAVLSGYKYQEVSDESNGTGGPGKYEESKKEKSGLEDQCRVKFQNPTNTIFYDPESPVIERVSVEYSDDLNDYDDEAKDKEQGKESDLTRDIQDYSDKDPSSFSLYKSKEEQAEEMAGAMELIKDTGLEELTHLASQINREFRDKPKDKVRFKEDFTYKSEEGIQDTEETEVVLRRKNDKNISDEQEEPDREAISSMIIHDLEENEPLSGLVEQSGREAVSSMIIHDSEEDEPVSELIEQTISGVEQTAPSSKEDELGVTQPEEAAPLSETAKLTESTIPENVAVENMEDDTTTVTREGKALEIDNVTEGAKDYPMEEIENLASEIADSIINDVAEECPYEKDDKIMENVLKANEDEGIDESEKVDSISANPIETSISEIVAPESEKDESPVIEVDSENSENALDTSDIENENLKDYPLEQIENLASGIADSILNDVAEVCPFENEDKNIEPTLETKEIEELDESVIDESVSGFDASLENTVLEAGLMEDKSELKDQTNENVLANEEIELSKISPQEAAVEELVEMEEQKTIEAVPAATEEETVNAKEQQPEELTPVIAVEETLTAVEQKSTEAVPTVTDEETTNAEEQQREEFISTSSEQETITAVEQTIAEAVSAVPDKETTDVVEQQPGALAPASAEEEMITVVEQKPTEAIPTHEEETAITEEQTPPDEDLTGKVAEQLAGKVAEHIAEIADEKPPIPDVSKEGELAKEDKSSFKERASALLRHSASEVLEIIYWRDVKTTGVVFGSMMFVLLSLSLCSLMSVLAYLSLAILTVTFSFRVYKSVMQAVQKTSDGHPFKKLLDVDLQLKEDVVQAAAQKIADNINNCSAELRRLYLVGDYIDSLKFGLLLWLLTYVGAWFNGMTLVILVVVSIFTLPKVYETYQGPIDQNVNLVRGQLNNIMAQVSAKIPFPKKKAKTQ